MQLLKRPFLILFLCTIGLALLSLVLGHQHSIRIGWNGGIYAVPKDQAILGAALISFLPATLSLLFHRSAASVRIERIHAAGTALLFLLLAAGVASAGPAHQPLDLTLPRVLLTNRALALLMALQLLLPAAYLLLSLRSKLAGRAIEEPVAQESRANAEPYR
jgi:uncharacterized membrane protein YhaH (DUF805 family)